VLAIVLDDRGQPGGGGLRGIRHVNCLGSTKRMERA
jgi:hypothetical protein